MAQYIQKSVIVAKIESRISDIKMSQRVGLIKKRDAEKKIALFKSILSLINTLEVKEVDLETEINKYISDNFFGSETMGFFAARTKEEPNDIDMALCARHFFELGLKAKKGEELC